MLDLLADSRRTPPTRYDRLKQIVRQGDASTIFAILSEGVVRLSKTLTDGRRQIVGFALPGDLIGAWLSDTVPYDADALTPAVAHIFPRADFMGRVSSQVNLMHRLQAYTMESLTFSQEHIAVLGCGLAEEKIGWFLIRWQERWEVRTGKSDSVPLPMTRQDIADYLGLTIETVSRTLSRLRDEGVIRPHRDRVDILDPERLMQLGALMGASVRPPV